MGLVVRQSCMAGISRYGRPPGRVDMTFSTLSRYAPIPIHAYDRSDVQPLTMPAWPEVSCGPGAVGEDRHVQGHERLLKIWQRFSLLSADD
jgi:hypothetical protein